MRRIIKIIEFRVLYLVLSINAKCLKKVKQRLANWIGMRLSEYEYKSGK
jgi:hypothetical protein